MKVCYFGTYDAFQSRNSVLIRGLRAVGVDVVECHVPLWRDTDDKMRAVTHGWRSPRLWRRLGRAYGTLLRQVPGCIRGCDAMVVGYAGHLDLFLAWPLARIAGIPLIFDAFNALTETVVDDRRLVSPDSALARLLRLVDVAAGRLAAAILVDTEAHRWYFHQAFDIPLAKLHVLPAGADPVYHRGIGDWGLGIGDWRLEIGQRASNLQSPTSNLQLPFRVLYFGQYIPLHGVDVIIDAARLLVDEHVEFHLVGRGQMYQATVGQAQGLTHVVFHHTWLSPAELLVRYIRPADVCLGAFDGGPKAGRVIPHKVYAALAAGKPVITGDSPAARELLTDGVDALLVPRGNPMALAAAVCRLRDDSALRWRLGRRGRQSFHEHFRPEVVGAAMRGILESVIVETREQQNVLPALLSISVPASSSAKEQR